MKKILTPLGFTLVEILVVITIISILSVIGMVIFGGVQKSARNSARKQDIQAIARALEVNKGTNTSIYNSLQPSQLASGIPQDPSGTKKYCILSRINNTTPAKPTVWGDSACPTAVESAGTSVEEITAAGGVPPPTATNFQVCALLENGPAPNIYCIPNQQ